MLCCVTGRVVMLFQRSVSYIFNVKQPKKILLGVLVREGRVIL